jgi:hypothetical protein
MRFLFIGSQFTLHASSPRSVALTQLRFALLTVTSSQRDLHPQVCAHAGRTKQKRASKLLFVTKQCGPLKQPRIFHPLKHPTAHRFRYQKALGAGPGDQRLQGLQRPTHKSYPQSSGVIHKKSMKTLLFHDFGG